MRRALLIAGVVGLLATGCGGGEHKTVSVGQAPAVPEPTEQQRATLLAILAQVDRDLVANEDRAVRRARNVCERIIEAPSPLEVAGYAAQEYDGPTTHLTATQAVHVVQAVQESFCQGHGAYRPGG